MKKNEKIRKALLDLFPDSWESQEIKKLSDKYEHLNLSHNRKWQLLKLVSNKLKFINDFYANESLKIQINEMLYRINTELNQNGRVNWRTK